MFRHLLFVFRNKDSVQTCLIHVPCPVSQCVTPKEGAFRKTCRLRWETASRINACPRKTAATTSNLWAIEVSMSVLCRDTHRLILCLNCLPCFFVFIFVTGLWRPYWWQSLDGYGPCQWICSKVPWIQSGIHSALDPTNHRTWDPSNLGFLSFFFFFFFKFN